MQAPVINLVVEEEEEEEKNVIDLCYDSTSSKEDEEWDGPDMSWMPDLSDTEHEWARFPDPWYYPNMAEEEPLTVVLHRDTLVREPPFLDPRRTIIGVFGTITGYGSRKQLVSVSWKRVSFYRNIYASHFTLATQHCRCYFADHPDDRTVVAARAGMLKFQKMIRTARRAMLAVHSTIDPSVKHDIVHYLLVDHLKVPEYDRANIVSSLGIGHPKTVLSPCYKRCRWCSTRRTSNGV